MRFLKSTRNSQSRRSRAAPRGRGKLVRFAAASLAVLAAAGLGTSVYLWRSGAVANAVGGMEAALLAKSAAIGLAVDTVLVEGRNETAAADILAALNVKRGLPLLAFDPGNAKARIEKLGWVRSASVQRRFPGTILVHLVERRPMALWQRDGKLALVDDTGTVITRESVGRYADLPIVVGADAPQETPALLAMLESQPDLKSHVTAAVRVSGRRWDLRLDGNVDVRLPEDGADVAWRRLAEMNRTYGLLRRGIVVIDLRMEDRLVLQLSPDALHQIQEPGADT